VTAPDATHRGQFVTLDGMGGAGKSTITRELQRQLSGHGYNVYTTTEPSQSQLGRLARGGSDVYQGLSLACLVAADRYHHLASEIRPQLNAGRIVLCDRYVASSYVLQRLDGVPLDFVEILNAAADTPDLAVVLTAEPEVAADRIARRGAHSRFETGLPSSRAEAELYRKASDRLTQRGYPLLTLDTTHTAPAQVAAQLATRIAQLAAIQTAQPPSA
jgi:dTMP kinase